MSTISKFWASEPQRATTSKQMRRFMLLSVLTLFAFTILMAYLSPFAYMASTSLKDLEMISNPDAPLLPSAQATIEYEGKEAGIYEVPTEQGVRELALVKPGRHVQHATAMYEPGFGPRRSFAASCQLAK